jgi:hypothetical protein
MSDLAVADPDPPKAALPKSRFNETSADPLASVDVAALPPTGSRIGHSTAKSSPIHA